jgi:hypothetical protein
MTSPSEIQFHETDLADLGGLTGKIAVFVDNEGRINPAAKRMNSLRVTHCLFRLGWQRKACLWSSLIAGLT